jgi:hypothetical protein
MIGFILDAIVEMEKINRKLLPWEIACGILVLIWKTFRRPHEDKTIGADVYLHDINP